MRTLAEAAEELRLRRQRKVERRHPITGRLPGKPILIEWQGEKLCIADWSRKLGLSRQLIGYRYYKGYPLDVVFRKGRITSGDHPDTYAGYIKANLPAALTAIHAIEPLHRHTLTTGEVWRLVKQNPATMAVITPLATADYGRVDCARSMGRVLRLLAGIELNGRSLAHIGQGWQIL